MTRIQESSNLPYKNLAEKFKAEGRKFKPKADNVAKKATKPLQKISSEGSGLTRLFRSADKAAEEAAKPSTGTLAKAGKYAVITLCLGAVACLVINAAKKNKAAKEEAAKAEAAKHEEPAKAKEIILPEPEAEETKAAEEKQVTEHTVKKGDNPWAIALEYLKSKNENFDYEHNAKDNKQLIDLMNKIINDNEVKVYYDKNGRLIGLVFPGDKLTIDA